MSKEEYFKSAIRSIVDSKYLQNAKQLRSILSDSEQRNRLIKRETGTDINTDNLVGMIGVIDKLIQELEVS
ncbi:hypothetical protein [Sharpea azabuensis]|uniref:hypothetical protein n=1 Tax=Sharpea azabuensis TaxID=322505 RepID=UPI001569E342|nr:hypothetical protein [Sharpea azabuensis]